MKQKAQDPIALQKEQQSRIVAPPAIETPTSKSIFNLEVPRQLFELHLFWSFWRSHVTFFTNFACVLF